MKTILLAAALSALAAGCATPQENQGPIDPGVAAAIINSRPQFQPTPIQPYFIPTQQYRAPITCQRIGANTYCQ